MGTYYYSGPIYYCGRRLVSRSPIVFTVANNISQAYRNLLYKCANGGELRCYDIVMELIKLCPTIDREEYNEMFKVKPKCETCNYTLTDSGQCPVCDYGEYHLLIEE